MMELYPFQARPSENNDLLRYLWEYEWNYVSGDSFHLDTAITVTVSELGVGSHGIAWLI
jgi:hypothetical protein